MKWSKHAARRKDTIYDNSISVVSEKASSCVSLHRVAQQIWPCVFEFRLKWSLKPNVYHSCKWRQMQKVSPFSIHLIELHKQILNEIIIIDGRDFFHFLNNNSRFDGGKLLNEDESHYHFIWKSDFPKSVSKFLIRFHEAVTVPHLQVFQR